MNVLKLMGCCGISLMLVTPVTAEDVQMFSDRVPTAAEMGAILFSDQPAASKPRGIKMRSINFNSKSTPKELPQVAGSNQASPTIGLPIKFAYNSADVLDESKPFLNEVGKLLSLPERAGESLIIEGHTDAGGSETYNRRLSEKRAQAVKDYLRINFNVSSNRLLVTGLGESQVLPNVNPYASVNRRVQFRRAP